MAVFIDARSPEDFQRGHIKGGLNIPWQSFERYLNVLQEEVPEDAWIITY
ncbi:MAG: rhodanese-like domain-containing protein [Deltaproteobacteria bacterium]|nr:rhodanese-like domain-containing protein [Deltaproteobacteria bacterium]